MGSELGVDADSKPEAVLDGVGIFWAVWASVWTALVAGGMGFLVSRRHTPMLRIRGLGLSLTAVALLHLYWASVQMGHMVGPLVPGDAEFWIMGTYLPLGIALFHASNSRFLHVARAQKRYAEGAQGGCVPGSRRCPTCQGRGVLGRGVLGRFRRLDYTSKTLMVVGLGTVLQLLLTVLMYVVSRKWHRSWGIPGTEVYGTEMEQKMQMGRGWEWWPSVVWQFFWAWVVAPITLWRARDIHDTQGWRVQTIGCAVANLHATPMWLVALYVPAMERVNQYWIPPQWICLSIVLMEILTVFLPCWEALRHQALRQETLDSIAQWEKKKQGVASGAKSVNSANSASTAVATVASGGRKSMTGSAKSHDSGESILTMSALEHVLERNPAPLQAYSALRDFSGENIAFLTNVAGWRSWLPRANEQTRELERESFDRALGIYTEFIGVRDAEFPINISSAELKRLEGVFERAARALLGDRGDVDPATPFGALPGFSGKRPEGGEGEAAAEEGEAAAAAAEKTGGAEERRRAQYWGEIPEAFDESVFDGAEKSIKYLVLTNTWPKFVRDRRASLEALEAMEAGEAIGRKGGDEMYVVL